MKQFQVEQPAKVAKTDIEDDVKKTELEAVQATEEEAPKSSEVPPEKPPKVAETANGDTETETLKKEEAASKSETQKGTEDGLKAETQKETEDTSKSEAQNETEDASKEETQMVTETVTKEDIEKPESMEVEEIPSLAQEVRKDIEEKLVEKMDESPESHPVVEEITDSNEIGDIPISNVEPIVEESIEKTEEKETEKMDTEVLKTDTSTELNVGVDDKNEKTKSEPKAPEVITEIEEITDKPLSEVAEVIDDLEPVVEEPTAAEDIEVLQNVGEVLEKECDEILSKVQDVTNLENIPLKPLLNPIAEETMETENVDSNDIVDRILDTELELEMKQPADIDLNTVAEITDTKTDAVIEKTEETVTTPNVATEVKTATEESTETNNVTEKKAESSPTVETPPVTEAIPETSTETKVEENKPVETETEVEKSSNVESTDATTVQSTVSEKVEADTEVKETKDTTSESNIKDKDVKEPQINGKTTNGDAENVVNGDASKSDELNSRLSVENGKEEVNGSNGDAVAAEQGQGDNKVETEVTDIKVKTVAVDETRTDPIEQPTEA